jgi:Arc/MetJ-type ribon-helix-helix transcriptional regulator
MKKFKIKNLRVTVRLEEIDRNEIEKLVTNGKFKNLSHVVRTALTKFLKDAYAES